jgi:hypothetical protein
MLKIEQFKNDIASGKGEALQAQNSWLEARSGFLLPSQEVRHIILQLYEFTENSTVPEEVQLLVHQTCPNFAFTA